ncbi:TPA: hypothetical protein ENX78_00745 [Candidatus Poribacteria bacterium]|nr:hypothetical protein [Candidatus Poribacteria bacterium]
MKNLKSAIQDEAIMLQAPDDTPIVINGSIPLVGQVDVSGSKHSILHILGTLWLLDGDFVIRNTPNIWDVRYLLEIYKSLGIKFALTSEELKVSISSSSFRYSEEKMELASKIRSSILLLASLLVRNKYVKFPAPTGDRIGNRPFAEFFAVLEHFGIFYSMQDGFIEARLKNPLVGNRVIDLYSHGNNRTALTIILAAANSGRTIIVNPLPQPEIIELCAFLDSFVCPVNVEFYPSGAIKIIIESEGKIPINSGGSFSVGPDKCELGFWIASAVITGGLIECHLQSPILSEKSLGPLSGIRHSLLDGFGVETSVITTSRFRIDGQRSKLKPINLIVPHNKELTTGLSIDVCPQFIPLMTLASGKSQYRDCKYGASRVTTFLTELRKLGMIISLHGNTLEIQGRNDLYGARVTGTDIRGAASLLIASLGAKGQSELDGMFYINRGYHDIVRKLNYLGANIRRKEL